MIGLRSLSVRLWLILTKPFVLKKSLESARKMSENIGKAAMFTYARSLRRSLLRFADFNMHFIRKRGTEKTNRALIYIHGGGYVTGEERYAAGFGSVICQEFELDTFCPVYRLAPEHPYPAALVDCERAYEEVVQRGYAPNDIILVGESAGGGLITSLCIKLRNEGKPLPSKLVALSPWVDQTLSSPYYKKNSRIDPTINFIKVGYYAKMYAEGKGRDELVSPIFANFRGMPPMLVAVGTREMLLGDALALQAKYLLNGIPFKIIIKKGMWHAYVLYPIKEAKETLVEIGKFIND